MVLVHQIGHYDCQRYHHEAPQQYPDPKRWQLKGITNKGGAFAVVQVVVTSKPSSG